MGRKFCPGLIQVNGMPEKVSVIRKSIKISGKNKSLVEFEYQDGWKKILGVKVKPKTGYAHMASAHLFPHGLEKGLAHPETVEALLAINEYVFPDLYRRYRELEKEMADAKQEKTKAENETKELKTEIKELQKKLAMKS